MASWNELLSEFESLKNRHGEWLDEGITESLSSIGRLRNNRMVLLYGSSFLQRPPTPWGVEQIISEDINGFMSCIYGMDFDVGLTLLLHTPGGSPNAAETIVKYLRSKFNDLEVIIPAFAMSAGTMISLSADRIIMGRQSQMGPIDPQMPAPHGAMVSAQAVVDQFMLARQDVLENETTAHIWAPILPALGPSLLVEAQNALKYGERMVAEWLGQWMLDGDMTRAAEVARHFNDATTHGSHGRRVDREEARRLGLIVKDLEESQELQDAVLKAYHLMTIMFEQAPVVKLIRSSTDRRWIKQQVPVSQ
ncbi:MAG: hypothetical protein OXT07_15775 [bacterium]|nr:hypothetical protein [bacterium]